MEHIQDSQKTFVYQRDDYSCGPACLATVSMILDVGKTYSFFRNLLDPCPKLGSCNKELRALATEYLPLIDGGEGTYPGGIAIANIIHRPSGDGHYVVFLGKDGPDIIYYDPYDHEIYIKAEAEIEWVSESGHLKKWSVNFVTPAELDFAFWTTMQEDVSKQKKVIAGS